jgi:hypothetical protein
MSAPSAGAVMQLGSSQNVWQVSGGPSLAVNVDLNTESEKLDLDLNAVRCPEYKNEASSGGTVSL